MTSLARPDHSTDLSSPAANANQALWEKGDFTRIAHTMRESGDAFVDRLGLTKATQVLDVGCGDGTTAIPAARRGAEVLGVDIARNLVAAGTARATEQGLANCRFMHGDAMDLEAVEDASRDVTLSIFGAMFAPRPVDVAEEMVRVTRSGGRIVMGNWIPGDPTLVAQILQVCSAYTPGPPAGFVSPMRWGVETDVVERFGAAGIPASRITCTRESWVFRHDGSPESFLALFRSYYGPTMNAFDAATQAGRADDLQSELAALFTAQNTSRDPDRTVIPATFLRVEVRR